MSGTLWSRPNLHCFCLREKLTPASSSTYLLPVSHEEIFLFFSVLTVPVSISCLNIIITPPPPPPPPLWGIGKKTERPRQLTRKFEFSHPAAKRIWKHKTNCLWPLPHVVVIPDMLLFCFFLHSTLLHLWSIMLNRAVVHREFDSTCFNVGAQIIQHEPLTRYTLMCRSHRENKFGLWAVTFHLSERRLTLRLCLDIYASAANKNKCLWTSRGFMAAACLSRSAEQLLPLQLTD